MLKALLYPHRKARRIIPFGPAIRPCSTIRRVFERLEVEMPLIVEPHDLNLSLVFLGSIVVVSIRGALAQMLIVRKTAPSAIVIHEALPMSDRVLGLYWAQSSKRIYFDYSWVLLEFFLLWSRRP
jgi:hypothetical protein